VKHYSVNWPKLLNIFGDNSPPTLDVVCAWMIA
jgi:hypothetical protein